MACYGQVVSPLPDGESQSPGSTVVDSFVDVNPRRPEPEQAKLERGMSVDRYVVLYELGVGGMGVVYAAYDPELDRKVALKLLHAQTPSRRARNRLLREAKAIAKVTHPNVVTVHDVGTFEGRVFVAMEFIDGVTFRHWVEGSTRSPETIVAVLKDAANGLAAAHDADLVHRDFKPDNILVEHSGRVVVLDFGLARRASTQDDSSAVQLRPPMFSDAPVDEFNLNLTKTGAKLGTPAYMAPEQHLGMATDSRTDQFSFCVVLWEALYGERPFRGDTQRAMALQVLRGDIEEPPRAASVPSRYRRVMTRGLSCEPDERYPTMTALLADLSRTVRPGLRRAGAWLLAAGLTAAAGTTWAVVRSTAAELCGEERDGWEQVWGTSRQAQVETAFGQTGLAFSTQAWTGVHSKLDAYVSRWQQLYTETCAATHSQRESSLQRFGLVSACLRSHRAQTAALVDEFASADATVVEHAVAAVNALPRLEACEDVAALASAVLPPADADMARRVVRLRERLQDARAKEHAARYAQGLAVTQEVLEHAIRLEYKPLVAEAYLQRARILERRGDYATAEKALLEAVWAAKASGHHDVEAQAWVDLVWVAGVELFAPKDGRFWADFARAAVERAGNDEVLLATLTHNIGGIHYRNSNLERALVNYRSALKEQRRLLGEDDPRIATTLNHIGNALMEAGDYAWSREYCQASLDLRTRVLGARHPKVAASLNNLAELARKEADVDQALAFAERSLDVVRGTGGPEEVVALLIAGWAEYSLGRYDAAAQRLTALERSRAHSPDARPGPQRYELWWRLGQVRAAQGRPREAAVYFERVVDPDAPSAFSTRALLGLAAANIELQKWPEAAAAVERAHGLGMNADLQSQLTKLRARLDAPRGETRTDR